MKAADTSDLLARYRIAGMAESMVQEQIERALRDEGVDVRREIEIATGSRIDFMVGPVGIEVKAKGTRAQITWCRPSHAGHAGHEEDRGGDAGQLGPGDREAVRGDRLPGQGELEMAQKAVRDARGARKEVA